jgi:hypothetical protein
VSARNSSVNYGLPPASNSSTEGGLADLLELLPDLLFRPEIAAPIGVHKLLHELPIAGLQLYPPGMRGYEAGRVMLDIDADVSPGRAWI